MVNEVKGYDVNFVCRGKSIHVNTNSLNEEKIQRLRDLGIEYYGENVKYCFYIPEEKRAIGCASPLPKENKLSLKVVNEITDFGHMFYDSEIKSLDLSNWDVSKGVNFRSMFYHCERLTSLDVSNWDVSSGENFNYMFYCCESLTSLNVSNWDVSKGKNFGYMFCYCKSLTSLDISDWDVGSGKDFSYMFTNCKKLTSLNLDNWDVSKSINFSCMFANCEKLTSLNLSGWKINQKADIEEMFNNCNSLKEVKAIGCDEYTINVLKEQFPKECKLVTGTHVMSAF